MDVGVVPHLLHGREDPPTRLAHEGNLSCELEDNAGGNVLLSPQTKVYTHVESDDIYFERVDKSVSMRIDDHQSPFYPQAAQVWYRTVLAKVQTFFTQVEVQIVVSKKTDATETCATNL